MLTAAALPLMSNTTPIATLILGLALGAAAGWWAGHDGVEALQSRVTSAEAALDRAEAARGRAERESGDWKAAAEAEVARNAPLEKEIRELERQLSAARNTPSAATPTPSTTEPAASALGDARDWDEPTFRQRLDMLCAQPAAARRSPLFPAVIDALRIRGQAGREWVESLFDTGISDGHKSVMAALLAELGDPASVKPLMAAYAQLDDPDDLSLRTAVLGALADLPGNDAIPLFETAWAADPSQRNLRRMALRGLGLRAQPIALQVARGDDAGVGPEMRLVALGNLLVRARSANYDDEGERTFFETVLPRLDGDAQAAVVLEALAGFSSKTSIPSLEAFAASDIGSAKVRDSARELAKRLAAGESTRPEPSNAPVGTDE